MAEGSSRLEAWSGGSGLLPGLHPGIIRASPAARYVQRLNAEAQRLRGVFSSVMTIHAHWLASRAGNGRGGLVYSALRGTTTGSRESGFSAPDSGFVAACNAHPPTGTEI
jgi:hypothetical protein